MKKIKINQSFTGRITFERITYSYPNSKDSALKNISLKINAGDKVAIVGSSGSGKTTLANLITKFIDSNIGNIYFDDIEIKKISVNELKKILLLLANKLIYLTIRLKIILLMESYRIKMKMILEKLVNLHMQVIL